MGAQQFENEVSTPHSMQAAFDMVRRAALHEYGHGGYTGTIAEKIEVVAIESAIGWNRARARALELLKADDERIDDKWGPAGAIRVLAEDEKTQLGFLFFGWASD